MCRIKFNILSNEKNKSQYISSKIRYYWTLNTIFNFMRHLDNVKVRKTLFLLRNV